MKFFLIGLAMCALTACNDSATSAEKAVDSSANATIDSLKNAADSSGSPGPADSATSTIADTTNTSKDKSR